MRKALTAAVAALSLVSGLTAAGAADAQTYYRRGNNSTGAAVAAGIAGLALGAALSSRGGTSYSYSYGYPSYGYGYGYPSYGYPGYGSNYGYPGYYGSPYYGRPVYRAPVVPRARVCTYWRYDRWGRAYQERRYC